MLTWQKILAVIAGSMLIAAGIDFFLVPILVLDGGFIGLAMIANYVFGAKIGLTLFLLSVPVFVLCWRRDRLLLFHSLYGMLFTSYFIDMLEPISYHFRYALAISPFASSLLGGLSVGIGFGLLLRFDASTGGMDLLARLLSLRFRWNVGILILLMDAAIVAAGGLLFSRDTLFLSAAAICVGDLATGVLTASKSEHR